MTSILDHWLYLSGTSEQRLANMAGVNRNTLHGWRVERYRPSAGDLALVRAAIALRNSELITAIYLGFIDETFCRTPTRETSLQLPEVSGAARMPARDGSRVMAG